MSNFSKNSPLVGLYAWGGPSTIDLLNTKYFSPKIDEDSFLDMYDLDWLKQAKETFNVTDMWISYSWGFSEAREETQKEFVRKRLANFKKLGIRTHLYVQGYNLVTTDFPDQDLWCTNKRGTKLGYSRNRTLTCPNNPAFQKLFLDRIEQASQEECDGVYVDNIIFGLPPFYVSKKKSGFQGCHCQFCRTEFESMFSTPLTLKLLHSTAGVQKYVQFRTRSNASLLQKASNIARKHDKLFGVNLYDPVQYVPELHFGYNLNQLSPMLDYYLIENHGVSHKIPGNLHLQEFIQQSDKPVFIVSYKKGVGVDGEYTQSDINKIWSEASHFSYAPCLKATEFITDKIWHGLYIDTYTTPNTNLKLSFAQPIKSQKRTLPYPGFFILFISYLYPSLVSLFFNRHTIYRLGSFLGVYQRQTHRFFDREQFSAILNAS